MKKELETEFEGLNFKLDVMLERPLKTAVMNLKSAISFLCDNELEFAKLDFLKARQDAQDALVMVPSFDSKLLATRIRVICTMYLLDNFGAECSRNSNAIHNQCELIFRDLMETPEVRSALSDEFGNFSVLRLVSKMASSSSARAKVLLEVDTMQKFLRAQTGPGSEGRYLITSPNGNAVTLDEIGPFGFDAGMTDVLSVYCAEGRLYAGCANGSVMIWDLGTYSPVAPMRGHKSTVTALCGGGGVVCSGSADKTVRVWDSSTMQQTSCLEDHDAAITGVCLLGGRIFSVSRDGILRMWTRHENIFVAAGSVMAHEGSVECCCCSETHVFTGGSDGVVKVWDAGVGTPTATLSGAPVASLDGHRRVVAGLCVSEDRLYVTADRALRVWSLPTDSGTGSTSELQPFKEVLCLRGDDGSPYCRVAVFGQRAYVASDDSKRIRVWDLRTCKHVATMATHLVDITSLCVYDGRVYSGGMDNRVYVRPVC